MATGPVLRGALASLPPALPICVGTAGLEAVAPARCLAAAADMFTPAGLISSPGRFWAAHDS